MDITSLIGTLLSSDSITGVSKTTKASSNDVQSILAAALPALLSGAQAQAEDKNTAASFTKALATHGKKDTSDLSSFLGKVDMDDGSKIINHLLGKGLETLVGCICHGQRHRFFPEGRRLPPHLVIPVIQPLQVQSRQILDNVVPHGL